MSSKPPSPPSQIKTNIYIDGYNLYYGCLKHTSYKWLDIDALFFDHILPSIKLPLAEHESSCSIRNGRGCIKFFTAEISAKIATSDESLTSQRVYHTALDSKESVKIIKGRYAISKDRPFLPHPNGKERPTENRDRVETLKVEEKQTDVNIALHAYHDAITDSDLDQIVFVTNDIDLVPAIEFIKKIQINWLV